MSLIKQVSCYVVLSGVDALVFRMFQDNDQT